MQSNVNGETRKLKIKWHRTYRKEGSAPKPHYWGSIELVLIASGCNLTLRERRETRKFKRIWHRARFNEGSAPKLHLRAQWSLLPYLGALYIRAHFLGPCPNPRHQPMRVLWPMDGCKDFILRVGPLLLKLAWRVIWRLFGGQEVGQRQTNGWRVYGEPLRTHRPTSSNFLHLVIYDIITLLLCDFMILWL